MKRILLAEDDKFLRRAAETKLRQRGFDVRSATDGDEAVALALKEPPDLVLLDLLMPKRDGLEVLQLLKASETTRAVPVVILSNSSKELEMQRASALGAAAYWVKANLSLQDLCERVDRLLGVNHEHWHRADSAGGGRPLSAQGCRGRPPPRGIRRRHRR